MLFVSLAPRVELMGTQLRDSLMQLAYSPVEPIQCIRHRDSSSRSGDVLWIGGISETECSEADIREIRWWQFAAE